MKVVITAGGGGHFAPVLSVIEKLPKDVSYTIVGRKYTFEGSNTLSLEYLTAQRKNLPFISLTTGRLHRNFSKHSLLSLLKTPVGLYQARKILLQEKPQVVMSFGGYVSVPVVLAAASLRIPIIIHEQTQHAGLANKLAARFAQKICISWESSRKDFPSAKIVLTGNPVKPEIEELVKKHPKKLAGLPTILITGGSQGSHSINELVAQTIAQILPLARVVHQTGDSHFNDFAKLVTMRESLSSELQKQYTLYKFIPPEEMLQAIYEADLVVSRSGINTTTELLLLQKPTLAIPFIYGQTNEQIENAQIMVKSGLGEVLQESEATAEVFTQKIMHMLSHLSEYKVTSDLPEISLHLTAAQILADLIVYVGNQTKN